MLAALHERGIGFVAIHTIAGSELTVGTFGEPTTAIPVVYAGRDLGELVATTDDREFLERVATLISAQLPRTG